MGTYNSSERKPSYLAKSPTTRSSIFGNRSPFQSRGSSLSRKNWRRWILASLLILIFFMMVCIILGYVLQQTAIYEETISSLNELKKKLDKCCFQTDIEKRNDTSSKGEKGIL